MEPKAITKVFYCNTHPSEKLQRVSIIDDIITFYCIDCALAIDNKQTKEAILPIKEFIQRTAASFEKAREGKTSQGDLPAKILALLDSEKETISKVSEHIEAEKVKVEVSFGEIIQAFSVLCNKAKQQIHTSLDNQLLNFRYNYHYLKGKVNEFYGKQTDGEFSDLTTETGIVSAVNKCESAADLEIIIKRINDEIHENKFLDNFKNKSEGMTKALLRLSNMIKSQAERLPKTEFSDSTQSQKTLDKINKVIDTVISEACSLKDEISQVSLNSKRFYSNVLGNSSDLNMIKNWLSSEPSSVKLNLLIRGTEDGFEAQTFHEKCDDKKNTLVLVRTEFGKVCGGFTELEWNATNDHKKQDNAFLFSVDLKTKFVLKKPEYSIYCDKISLPGFGGGCDLYLSNYCDTVSSSYSNLGHSYDPVNFAGDANLKSLLTGGNKFKVLEYEVFEVEGFKLKVNK